MNKNKNPKREALSKHGSEVIKDMLKLEFDFYVFIKKQFNDLMTHLHIQKL